VQQRPGLAEPAGWPAFRAEGARLPQPGGQGQQFQDQPLAVYAKNYRATLTVLSSTLKLQATAGPDGPPDGTADVIKQNLKDARTDYDDVSRYCSQ